MLADEVVRRVQHTSAIERHAGLEGQVLAQHGSHADRVDVVVWHAEIEDGAAECCGLDGVAERRDLVSDGLDHDVGPVARIEMADPAVARGAHDGVDTEVLSDSVAVDGVYTGDVPGTENLCGIGEQQPYGALPD